MIQRCELGGTGHRKIPPREEFTIGRCITRTRLLKSQLLNKDAIINELRLKLANSSEYCKLYLSNYFLLKSQLLNKDAIMNELRLKLTNSSEYCKLYLSNYFLLYL